MSNEHAAPGWYPDATPGLMRWWDGTEWTESTRLADESGVQGGGAPAGPRPSMMGPRFGAPGPPGQAQFRPGQMLPGQYGHAGYAQRPGPRPDAPVVPPGDGSATSVEAKPEKKQGWFSRLFKGSSKA